MPGVAWGASCRGGQQTFMGWTHLFVDRGSSVYVQKTWQEGGSKVTWKKEFELPWRKAGLLKSFDD